MIDVTRIAPKTTVPTGPPGVHVYFGATPPLKPATSSVELSATIKILKQKEPVFSNSYRNTHQKVGATCAQYHGVYLEEAITKTFESLLAEAVPQVTSSLASTIAPH